MPTAEYEFFKESFPQYGSVKWFINSALLEFNDRIRANPSLKQQINAAIQQMLDTSKLIAQAGARSADDA